MQLRVGEKVIYDHSWKRMLYTACFFAFCLIDQRIKTGSGLDGIIESFRDSMGIVLALIIISHYKLEEFKKWRVPYMVWAGISLIGGIVAFFREKEQCPFLNDWIIVILDVIIWGFIVIHTFIHVVLEKERPELNKKFLAVWLVMMLWMITSRNDSIWPFCYLILFGCFYLTDFTKDEKEDLLQGCLDGIILAFFAFQGFCCVFRPYDVLRYVGIHNNSNLNALFYLEVFAAALIKNIYVAKNGGPKAIRISYWLMLGAVLSCLFLTIGRIGWITAFILGLLFLGFLNVIHHKKKFLQNGMLLVLCVFLTFPVCFTAIRYLPPVFHHPIWFWGEWDELKVHSWDSWDSEKYVDIDEFLEAALGRIVGSVENVLEHSPFLLKTDAAESIIEEDPRAKAAVLQPEQTVDDLLVRSTIYKYYFEHLNWRGHPYEEQGFQLTQYYWIGHAHNIYLQYGTDFGIPVMVLFGVLIVWSCAVCWKRGHQKGSIVDMAALFFILIPAVFGLFEYAWGVGGLSITMLFVAWRQVAINDGRQ